MLDKAREEVWPRENPAALQSSQVEFQPHDFFQENPVKGADIYWLRYIMLVTGNNWYFSILSSLILTPKNRHDWSDEYCVRILKNIGTSMGPTSRLLICDQVMNTTVGFADIASAPEPLPANYGYFVRYSHQRDITMMSIINGIERTPGEFKDIIERAGLVMRKIYDCRSQVSLIECVLPEAPRY